MLESHYKFLHPLEISQKKAYFDLGDSKPDVFFEPKVVWEVLAADLSLSPVYSAAKGIVSIIIITLPLPFLLSPYSLPYCPEVVSFFIRVADPTCTPLSHNLYR